MGSKKRYAKYFPVADERHWYIELIVHNKKDYDEAEAWRRFMYTSKQDIIDYHDFAGCYLEILREQGKYERSKQGRIDILRDEILDYEEGIEQCRKGYAKAREDGHTQLMEFQNAHAAWLKELIADNQKEIIRIMTGRKK